MSTIGPDDPTPSGSSGSEAGPPDRERGLPAPEQPAERLTGRAVGEHRTRYHPWRIAVLALVVLGLIVVIGGYVWINDEASPSGRPGPQVIVTVRPGSGVSQLASTLESKHVIGSSLAYRIWSHLHSTPAILSGSYAFHQNISFSAVNAIVATGPNVFPLEIPPGFTVAEAARRVGQLPGHSAASFAALADSGSVRSPWQPAGSTNLDGLLGVGEYIVVPGETDTKLLGAMIDRFDADANSLNLTAGAAALGLTPYQVITMASIVQKEGVIGKNLGPVARVIVNRLHDDMPLQMDSTVLYSEGRDGGPVTSSDLKLDTPYNTYLNKGLTPTPICFPSQAALAAAINPPAGSELFFVVVQPDGTEAFADTFAEQQANEALAKTRGLG